MKTSFRASSTAAEDQTETPAPAVASFCVVYTRQRVCPVSASSPTMLPRNV